jgi:4-amino-4-deoxy-L-arabinose transferase-like glycosyltransferase
MTPFAVAALVGLICATAAPAPREARRSHTIAATLVASALATLTVASWFAPMWIVAVVGVTALALPRSIDGSQGDRNGSALSCAVICGGAAVAVELGPTQDAAAFGLGAVVGCVLATTSTASALSETIAMALIGAGVRLAVALQLLVAWASA